MAEGEGARASVRVHRTLTRAHARRVPPSHSQFFTFFQFNGTVGLLLGSLILSFAGSNAKNILFFVLAAVAGIGVLGVFAHLCIVKAFQAAQASFLAPFNYVKLIWATVLGYVLFGEIPDNRVFAGGAIIVATGLYVLWRERRRVD